MAEYTMKYADPRGEMHTKVAEGASENEVRDKMTQQGFLVYSVRPAGKAGGVSAVLTKKRGKKLDLEKFLIFNSQFVTLIRIARLPRQVVPPKNASPVFRIAAITSSVRRSCASSAGKFGVPTLAGS